jgi:hypothetical protein
MGHSWTGIARRTFQLFMLAFMAWSSLPASAGDLSPRDQKQIIEVVRSQLDAFAHDDAAKAFSYAAPNVQRLMGNAKNFLDLVRTRYEVVYRPSSTTFMQPVGQADDAVLKVQMTDESGDTWTATYTLQKQKNKAWRITGCSVDEATGTLV